jgi:aryl-alcohol dehydrogenase-like predicted oxidoreductase
METRSLGRLGGVSALSLGGGGVGGVYGSVARAEAVATVRAAVDAGITLLDLAPTYGPGERSPDAELLVGEAFGGRLPEGVRVTSKVMLGDTMPTRTLVRSIRTSLKRSLERIRVDRIDILFLHSYVGPPGTAKPLPDVIDIASVREIVRPELERLAGEGLIAGWGLTGIGHPDPICDLLAEEGKPAAIQCVTNALDSVGDMWPFDAADPPDNRRIRSTAVRHGVAVMGIRAVAAGALTDRLDRTVDAAAPAAVDHRRAQVFRELARAKGASTAELAHRYALSLPGVATVIVGAKTRIELAECLAAETAGPLDRDEVLEIEAACSSAAGVPA